MSKRTYGKPVIFRVELRHEQAVLSPCSTNSTASAGNFGNGCWNHPGWYNCKKSEDHGDDDSLNNS